MKDKLVKKELIDFIKILYPNSNLVRYIYDLSYSKNRLEIIIGSESETEKRKIIFNNVLNFVISNIDEPEDKELPQSIIGFDYWETNKNDFLNWEINGDGCTWDFNSSMPEISVIE